MGLFVPHLLSEAIRPALARLEVARPGLATIDAERLLLMIAAHESGFKWLRQHPKGPALGLWQVEVATYEECWRWLIAQRTQTLTDAVTYLATFAPFVGSQHGPVVDPNEMTWNLRFAAAMARVNLLRLPGKLPSHTDIPAMAEYAKKYWNTHLGAAKPEDYRRAYEKLVLPALKGVV